MRGHFIAALSNQMCLLINIISALLRKIVSPYGARMKRYVCVEREESSSWKYHI